MIKPENSYITISNGASSAMLYCNDISFSQVSEPFERPEYKTDATRKALENTGVAPLIVQMIYGTPLQITSTGLVSTTARNLQPDDNLLPYIYQKLYITRYVLRGNTSINTDTSLMFTWSTLHRVLQDNFAAHLKYASAAVSIQELTALQGDNFDYLQHTGISFTSLAIGTVADVVIKDFNVILDYYIPSNGTNLYSWTATLDSTAVLSDTPY